jgi:hypothetical protein
MFTVNLQRLGARDQRLLIVSNVLMIATLVVHDLDHVRQAANWNYDIPAYLWALVLLTYVPSGVSLLLALKGSGYAAHATAAGSMLIAFEIAKLHLCGTSLEIWGVWNRSFFDLGVDAVSWGVLVGTIFCGVCASMTGVVALRRMSRLRAG